jgi:hypothetical protein
MIHHEWEVREQAIELLSHFATAKRAREIFDYAFPSLKQLLED